MKRTKKIQIYILCAFCAAAAFFGAFCLYFGAKTEYNPALGYFDKGSVFAVALYLSLALGAAAGIVSWVLFARLKCADKPIPQKNVLTVISCVLISGGIAADCIEDAVEFFGAVSVKYSYIHYIMWILGAAAAVLMLVCAVPGKSNNPVHSLGYFVVPLFLASKILIIYFDRSVAVNSPVKMISQVSLICFMLMFTAETGISLGRGNIFPRWLCTLCISAAVGGVGGIGALAVCLAGINFPGITLCDAAMMTAFSLYAFLRLISVPSMEISPCRKAAGNAGKNAEPAESAVSSAEKGESE